MCACVLDCALMRAECSHTWEVQASSVGAKGLQAAVEFSRQCLQDSQ